MKTTCVSSCVLSLFLLVFPLSAPAGAQGIGVRAGISGEPGQFYVGVHDEMGPVDERLWFRPNLEIGIGDNAVATTINVEFAYKLDVGRRGWHPYIGAGPALNLYRVRGDTNAGGGFNVLLGVQHTGGFFAEFKAGFADSPDVKFGVGYVFPR